MSKRIYFHGVGKAEGNGLSRDVLGGKGQGLHEMTAIGLSVPAGFTITIDTCAEYYAHGRKFPNGLEEEVKANVAKLEEVTGKKFGDSNDPLLVSVRSGAARSMPGMMETILNLGLNDVSVEGLAKKTNNPRFAYDAYRRFIQMYSTTAMGIQKEALEELLHELKHKLGVKSDFEIPADALKNLCGQYKALYKEKKGEDLPQDPLQQLWGAIQAVFCSWEADRAVAFRRAEKITDFKGIAANIVQMVFGNMGATSCIGVCFTRDPNTGENAICGDCLINAQGEDIVVGIRTPMKVVELKTRLPKVYEQLCQVRVMLEKNFKDMQDLEFTVEEGKLYLLQCRTGKRSPAANVKIAVDMAREGLIDEAAAVSRVDPKSVEQLLSKVQAPECNEAIQTYLEWAKRFRPSLDGLHCR